MYMPQKIKSAIEDYQCVEAPRDDPDVNAHVSFSSVAKEIYKTY